MSSVGSVEYMLTPARGRDQARAGEVGSCFPFLVLHVSVFRFDLPYCT